MKKITFITLGCKVNQCESSYLMELLRSQGFEFVDFSEKADVYVVHGCAVTSRAAYETRQFLHRARRINPKAFAFVVAGCAAQFEGQELAQRGIVTHVLGNEEKYDIANIFSERLTCDIPCVMLSEPRSFSRIVPLTFHSMLEDRARGYVKIQDGCNAFCSYCIVPYLRGRSRSLSPDDVCREIQVLRVAGFEEIVLTGIHLGDWLYYVSDKPMTLIDLLAEIEHRRIIPPRIRLSSLEPRECTEELVSFLAGKEWFCHHFHIPLQSGDAEILKLMNRHYSTKEYEDVIHNVRRYLPNASIGADVIVGFPGEDDKAWRRTYELVEKLPITYLHVFPFSPRRGTPAAGFPNRVSKEERKYRVSMLRRLSRQKKLAFMENQIGQYMDIIIEKNISLIEGMWQGKSGNYLTVIIRGSLNNIKKGNRVRVRLDELDLDKEVLMGSFESFIP